MIRTIGQKGIVGLIAAVMLTAACSSTETTSTTVAATAAPTTTSAPAATVPPTTVATNDPMVTFDGANCAYSGPTEFEVMTIVEFTAVNESDVVAEVVLLRIDDGLNIEDVAGIGGLTDLSQLPDGVTGVGASSHLDPGQSTAIGMPLTVAGNHLPMCLTRIPEVADRESFLSGGFLSVS